MSPPFCCWSVVEFVVVGAVVAVGNASGVFQAAVGIAERFPRHWGRPVGRRAGARGLSTRSSTGPAAASAYHESMNIKNF